MATRTTTAPTSRDWLSRWMVTGRTGGTRSCAASIGSVRRATTAAPRAAGVLRPESRRGLVSQGAPVESHHARARRSSWPRWWWSPWWPPSGVVTAVRRSFPDRSGSVDVPGLSASVEVRRDDQGVPQVYADNAADLFYAQGYVHAQDRFFEMDLRRHITAGQPVRARRHQRRGAGRRQGRAHPRLAAGGRAGAAAAVGEQPPVPAVLRRRRERLHLRALAVPAGRRVRRPRPAAAVVPRSGRGRRSTPSRGSRPWPGTSRATTTTRSRAAGSRRRCR